MLHGLLSLSLYIYIYVCVFMVGSPTSVASTTSTSASSGSHRTAWMKFLARWTELVQPLPIHFDTKGNSLSRLDRAFISCPNSLTLKLNIGWSVVGKPEECFANFESDHAPLAVGFGRPSRPRVGELPIPRWNCKHPNFQYHLNSLIDSICSLGLEVSQQLFIYQKVY